MPENDVDKYFLLNVFWLISGIVWLPIYIVYEILERLNVTKKPKWVKWWGNRVDNLPDALMEWLHCHKIPFTNKQLNISFLMKNRTTTWDIIREHKPWPNCDPEDFDPSDPSWDQ